MTRGTFLSVMGAGAAGVLRASPQLPEGSRKLRELLEQKVERRETAGGALLVLHKGEVVFREAFGFADLATKRPFRVDGLCFLASLTKTISSTLMVMLAGRGVLSLDDPVEKWLPEFKGIKVQGKGPAASPPLVWQLLSHRSGLPGNDYPGAVRAPRGPRSALAEIVRNWAKTGLLAEPGARFAYGNAGYMTASRIVEVATGRAYEAVLTESLLQPLAMSRTTFRPSAAEFEAMPRRYSRTKEGLKPDTRVYPVPEGDALVNPAGGLFSTVDDLSKFLRFHLDGGMAGRKRLVSRESLARMYRPHPPQADYGLGFNVLGNSRVRHLGASGTLFWIDFENQLAGVLLTQVQWGNQHDMMQLVISNVNALLAPAR